MLTPFIAYSALVLGQAQGAACPIMGHGVDANVAKVDYLGVRYGFCCGGCPETFANNPDPILKKADGKAVWGTGLFDPVTRRRLDPKDATGGKSQFQNTVFYFENAASKAKFDANPKLYAVAPAKELLVCPVSGETIKGYAKASGYIDVEGVRYYICCASCDAPLAKDAAKYTAKHASKATKPKGIIVK